jgi:D-beta-D-heptose 7-phosphate kinase / D-beta-D-heptose 1-phosphate adenosyltransferase
VLTDTVIAGTIEIARALGIRIIVDPKSRRLERYRGASVITPNAGEAFDATGIEVAKDDEEAERAGRIIIERASVDCVLITRGHKGVSCIARGDAAVHFPASAREVFDVVGAGDTLVATLALALGAKEELEAASRFANVAAGVVVGKRGTATVSASELEDEIVRLSMGSLASLDAKIYSIHDLLTTVATWRRDGQKIGFTNGCFDLLHVGHLSLLNFARSQCDRLIVGLNGDGSAKRLKGPTRPINGEHDRAMVLAGLSSVNAVVIFGQDTPLETIRAISPDVLVKGADYAVEQIVGRDIVLANGGKVLTCEIVPQKSTTRVVKRISAEQEKVVE